MTKYKTILADIQETIISYKNNQVKTNQVYRPEDLNNTLDQWQQQLITDILNGESCVVCCSRQSGKTEAVAIAAFLQAFNYGRFVLVLSPSDEQSKEFLSRIKLFHRKLSIDFCDRYTMHEIIYPTGGRILALPNNERTVRCRSGVHLLVIDEAARVPDQLYAATTPMLAVTRGQKVLLSTPFGKRGFFYEEFIKGKMKRYKITWRNCPRISEEFIQQELTTHGPLWVRQEYECEFIDITSNIFNIERIKENTDIDNVSEEQKEKIKKLCQQVERSLPSIPGNRQGEW
jgi:hypothetical protein